MMRKVITLALMIAAPVISGRAFYEYAQVMLGHAKPSYPFGKAFMVALQTPEISFLSTYANVVLSIGVLFLVVAIIAFVSSMIRAMMNLIWLAIVVMIGFMVFRLLNL